MELSATHAVIRFGLGRRGEEALPANPAAWLAHQLDGPDPALAVPIPPFAESLATLRARRRDPADKAVAAEIKALYEAGTRAAVETLLTTATPFRERLVWFWANHFTVSLRRGEVRPFIHAYIRDAIRPHVTGRFADMVLATVRHPAMLLYLDNAQSIGPDSVAGMRQHRGLNENLARECLELHTVTPAARYTQADVTAFARLLTGWSIDPATVPPGFLFRPLAHEPGDAPLLGQHFPPGIEGGMAALAFLADHPSTHRHLATQLVRHFVADDPPAAAVGRIEAVLRTTQGDLKAAALALTRLPAAWQPLRKLRAPADYVVAVLRALDLDAAQRATVPVPGIMAALGQPFLSAPLPNGWPDTAADWAGPEAMLRRVDWAFTVSGRGGGRDPDALATASLGPLLGTATREAMDRAGSRREALAMLFASPEFQRR
jgi:uncharacterized protein (DUF1800 family)